MLQSAKTRNTQFASHWTTVAGDAASSAVTPDQTAISGQKVQTFPAIDAVLERLDRQLGQTLDLSARHHH